LKVLVDVKEVHNDDIEPVLAFHDVGYLTFDQNILQAVIENRVHSEMLALGSAAFQNSCCQFPVTNGRSMQASWFTKLLTNGSKVNRSWLILMAKTQGFLQGCKSQCSHTSKNCKYQK
jgi:hypothetical protein